MAAGNKKHCPSGKQVFVSEDVAVGALLDLWSRVDFGKGAAPITVYACSDCGQYHFTSKGARHPKLDDLLSGNDLVLRRKAAAWEQKFR